MAQELIVQGNATDTIWAMASPDGTIGLCFDSGDAGTIFLTPAQARAVVDALVNALPSP